MAYSSLSALTGADNERNRRRRRRRRRRSPSISTPNAILGGRGVREATEARRSADRTAKRRRRSGRRQRVKRHTRQREGLQYLAGTAIPQLQARVARLSTPQLFDTQVFGATDYERRERLGRAQTQLRSAQQEAKRLESTIATRRGRRAEPITALEAGAAIASAFPPLRVGGLAARGIGALASRGAAGAASRGAARAAPAEVRAVQGVARAAGAGAKRSAQRAGRAVRTAPKRGARATKRTARNVGTREGREYLAGNVALGKIATASGVAPATVGSVVAADIAGELQANPIEALKTTARVIPASLAYLGTTGYDIGQTGYLAAENVAAALRGQDAPNTGREILGPVRGAAEQGVAAFEALAPYVSGDPAQVKEAVESETGYIFAPLIPKGVQAGAAVGRRGVRAARESTTAERLRERGRARRAEQIRERGVQAQPSPLRRAGQIIVGGPARKRIAVGAAREMRPERFRAGRATQGILNEAYKVKTPSGASRRQVEGTVSVLADYGIGRENPRANLVRVHESLREAGESPVEITSTRQVLKTLDEHPELLDNPRLWNAVDIYKERTRPIETSPVAKYRAQGRILGQRAPEEGVPGEARRFTAEQERAAAYKDVRQRQVQAGKSRRKARTIARPAERRYEGAKRRRLRSEVSEAETRGRTRTLVSRHERSVLRDQPEYLEAVKTHNKAGRALTQFRKKYGNEIESLRVRGGDSAKAQALLTRMRSLEATTKTTRVRVNQMREKVMQRAEREASKIARGEPGNARLASLSRAPRTSLAALERKGATVAQMAKRERDALAGIDRARREGSLLRAEAKLLDESAKKLRTSLDRYSKAKGPHWDNVLLEEFVQGTKARAAREGFEEPAYVSHARPPVMGDAIPGQRTGASRVQHPDLGRAERADIVDRSIENLIGRSVYAPRMRRAMHRFVRRFLEDATIPVRVDGKAKRAITDDEWEKAVAEGRLDPRSHVRLPAREWSRAIQDERFDLQALHSDVVARIGGEASSPPGAKSVVVKREAAKEFADQINPTGGIIEKGLSSLGIVGTRAILGFSPAWALSQVVAEGSQALVAVGPIGLARGFRELAKFRKNDPEGYEDFHAVAGAGDAALYQPTSSRPAMTGPLMRRYGNAIEAIRRTRMGRAIYGAATGQLLGVFDRWKGGKYRAAVLAARLDKDLGKFSTGLQGALKAEAKMTKAMQGMNRTQQLAYLAKNPRLMERHLDYLDDVMGNWHAFTRFERAFAPALIFYPYIRMSLRWTFMTYPKRHPIKTQILYMLAQRNAEELEALLGDEPVNFFDYSMPVIHGEDAEVSGVLPGGRRFGAPGTNVLVESIGEDNVAGLFRGLNPFLSTAIFAGTGVNPFSGEQEAGSTGERALSALNQLLSMPAPIRTAGLNEIGEGEQSELSKRFEELDPNRTLRSIINPFAPQTAENARAENELSRLLEQSGNRPEFSELAEAVRVGDMERVAQLRQELNLSREASAAIDRLIPDQPEAAAAESIYYGSGSTSSSGPPSGILVPRGASSASPSGVLRR